MKLRYFFVLMVLLTSIISKGQEVNSTQDTTKTRPTPALTPQPKTIPTPIFTPGNELEFLNTPPQKLPDFDFTANQQKPSFFNKAKPYILPAGLMATSLFSLNKASNESFLNKYTVQNALQKKLSYSFNTSIDDYSMHAPLAITFGLKLAGIKGQNDGINTTLLAAKSHLLSSLIVTNLKKFTAMERPDGSSFSSFPSGHTSTAFVNATIMHMEFGEISPWYSVAGYTIATATGALRMMNNVHWLPDVLAGAAIGIATTRLVYATHKYRWGKRPKNLVVAPTYSNKMFGVALAYTF